MKLTIKELRNLVKNNINLNEDVGIDPVGDYWLTEYDIEEIEQAIKSNRTEIKHLEETIERIESAWKRHDYDALRDMGFLKSYAGSRRGRKTGGNIKEYAQKKSSFHLEQIIEKIQDLYFYLKHDDPEKAKKLQDAIKEWDTGAIKELEAISWSEEEDLLEFDRLPEIDLETWNPDEDKSMFRGVNSPPPEGEGLIP